jgi:proteasome lid subunit RPN8/RPN11
VTAVWPLDNLEEGDRSRGYVIAPEELLQAYKAARNQRREVVGYYHSHPDASAAPSARDLAEAAPGVSYLIVAVSDREIVERRAWRLRHDSSGFDEQRLV